MNVSALILAGGKATRLGGIAKHEILIDGVSIFDRQVAVLAPNVREILVSSPRDIAGYRTVRDTVEGAGPLAGIAAGLAACTTRWLLVVAGDMPYLTSDLIQTLIDATDEVAEPIDAVGVRSREGLPEPLLCVLNARVRPIVEGRLAAKRYKASGLLTDEGLAVRWLRDAPAEALRNINSPEDLGR
ncbi:MAG: molybdenum cofactor guanylyltransferase [Kofleriaceae bacterium]|nr:molybdenum cofactor guanylyltransferase [Kofleriaceae bacterium]